ncbi:hypothetical protein QVD17_22877 [Tagetes erecta]|uniref:Uncharacterized protein n=1 Tax=Tagetes erecta TaxID=13708 RepID=A0AAD8KIC0_TARER|nr:hypothetical protein QVD17_22877 [Tagetes erecta]
MSNIMSKLKENQLTKPPIQKSKRNKQNKTKRQRKFKVNVRLASKYKDYNKTTYQHFQNKPSAGVTKPQQLTADLISTQSQTRIYIHICIHPFSLSLILCIKKKKKNKPKSISSFQHANNNFRFQFQYQ